MKGFVCIFACGKYNCSVPPSRHRRRSSAPHLIFESYLKSTNKKDRHQAVFLIGGLEGIRTLDPRNANAMRSQLRYKPEIMDVL